MSFGLKLSKIDSSVINLVRSTLTFTPQKTEFIQHPKKVYLYSITDNKILNLPLGVWKDYLDDLPCDANDFLKINKKAKFSTNLLTPKTDPLHKNRDQVTVGKRLLNNLDSHGTCFLAAHTGFGKTCLATWLICKLRVKTIVLCHLNKVKNQWVEEITEFTDGSVSVSKTDPSSDVYIVGIQKAIKLPETLTTAFGFVIVDEAHLCTASCFSHALLKFSPRYLLGLSATPDRQDGLHALMRPYFGSLDEYITIKEIKDFTLVKYCTSYKPEIVYNTVFGKSRVNWTHAKTSLAVNETRTKEICEIAVTHLQHKIIILVDRTVAVKQYNSYLLSRGQSVDTLFGRKNEWDKSSRILVCEVKKGGVGLNDTSFTMIIIACDMKDVRQCEGRVRTVNNVVYDIVDDYPLLEKHYSLRLVWYRQRAKNLTYRVEKS